MIGLILMYHRVAELALDPWALAVTPRHFAEHLHVIKQSGRPVALRRLDDALDDGAGDEPLLTVTLDDGYADNLEVARPLLDRHDVPATVFVTTGAIGGGREFWWDELEAIVLHAGPLPDVLRLRVDGEDRTWRLGEAARNDEAAFRRHLGWRADGGEEPTGRHALYRALYHLMRDAAPGERARIMDDLLRWSGRAPGVRASHRIMSVDEVVALARGGLVDVGSHSVTHPSLPGLPVPAQQAEIAASKSRLEEMLGRPVTAFAYPHGLHGPDTVRLVREAGFGRACSVEPAVVRPGADRFRLPRLSVGDWDGDEFGRRLDSWTRT